MQILKPFGPVAGAFYRSNNEFDIIMGPVGSAKTTAAAMRLMRHAYQQKPDPDGVARTRFAVVRNTRRQLNDTTIKTWREWFPDDQYGAFRETAMSHHWQFKPKDLGHTIDCEVVFRALDDASDKVNLLSAEYTGAWFNEAREIDSEIILHMLRRVGRFPANRCTYFGCWGDTNAFDTLSFLYEKFVLSDIPGWKLFKQPGGLDRAAENVENLPGGREYYVRAAAQLPAHECAIYVHNQHVSSREGKPIFASYVDTYHSAAFEYDRSAPLYVGCDNSGVNPAAVIGQKTHTGQWRICAELTGQDTSISVFAQNLKRFIATAFPLGVVAKITVDPSGDARGPQDISAERVLRQTFSGVPVVKARTNDPATRIEAVDKRLRENILGGPSMLIHPSCRILRKACISEYHYRKLKLSGRGDQYAEQPDKNHPYSDVADALQYLMLGGGEGAGVAGAPDDFAKACAARGTAKKWSVFGQDQQQ